ncbi:MAG TPA: hypothetical protein VLY87_05640 [Flavobacterium sp.]|nr:hypothetical protein [Flavobacterium sp.]
MTTIHSEWKQRMTTQLNQKTEWYSEQEKTNIQYTFLLKCIELVGIKNEGYQQTTELKSRIEIIIELLPQKTADEKKLKYRNTQFINRTEKLKNFVKKHFKLEDESSVRQNAWFYAYGVGMSLGVFFGVLLGKTALGICFGIPLGMLAKPFIENYLMQEAKRKEQLF